LLLGVEFIALIAAARSTAPTPTVVVETVGAWVVVVTTGFI
jgi:hypothetical protein